MRIFKVSNLILVIEDKKHIDVARDKVVQYTSSRKTNVALICSRFIPDIRDRDHSNSQSSSTFFISSESEIHFRITILLLVLITPCSRQELHDFWDNIQRLNMNLEMHYDYDTSLHGLVIPKWLQNHRWDKQSSRQDISWFLTMNNGENSFRLQDHVTATKRMWKFAFCHYWLERCVFKMRFQWYLDVFFTQDNNIQIVNGNDWTHFSTSFCDDARKMNHQFPSVTSCWRYNSFREKFNLWSRIVWMGHW